MIDRDVEDYYERAPEASRLTQGAFLHVARLLESEPAMIGCSAHMLIVGRKR